MARVCPSWLSFILYNPIRKIFTDRQRVLDESRIRPGSVVLEIGCGNGFFTEAIAGRADKVIAVELQSGMVRKLKKRVETLGGRVEIIEQDIATAELPQETADACLLYYSFHEIARQQDAAAIISRTVRHGGVISIYEPTVEVSRSDMDAAIAIFKSLGCALEWSRHRLFTRSVLLRKV